MLNWHLNDGWKNQVNLRPMMILGILYTGGIQNGNLLKK